MNNQFQAFIFDMDGTIVETNEDICDAVNHSLRIHDLKEISYDECKSYLGNGSVKLIQRAMKGSRTEEFQSVFDDYYRYYLKNFRVKTKPYDGLVDALKRAKEKDILLFIYTNKPEKVAEEIVNFLFPKGLFEKMVGIPLGGKTKPDPASFMNQTEKYHLDYEKVAYFGDSVVDIQTAHNLHVKTICSVLWGFQSKETLLSYPIQPTYYLKETKQILELIETGRILDK